MREVTACRLDELQDGAARRLVVEGRALALIRLGEHVFACLDSCPHKGGYLSEGQVSAARGEVICPWHRFRFHLETGASVTNPELKVPTFRARVEEGSVRIELP